MPATLVTSRDNPRVKQLRAALRGNERLSAGLVGVEGEQLLREALRSGLTLEAIFLDEQHPIPDWLPGHIQALRLPGALFSSVAHAVSPQGIAGLVVRPGWKLEEVLRREQAGSPLLLIAAGVQDPGNLGTLIRSAEAFGASAVLTTAGTVSEWNQKALRASAGSVFRVPVVAVSADDLAALKLRGVRILAAVAPGSASNADSARNGGAAIPAAGADLAGPCALMIGNEGAGLGEEWVALADACIAIPTPGRIESLNAAVAGSLLLYEASRQRTFNGRPEGNRRQLSANDRQALP